MKKVIFGALILTFLILLVLPASAGSAPPDSMPVEPSHPPRLVDEASLLDSNEASGLIAELDRISKAHGCDVAVVTVNSTGGKLVEVFADDYYDNNGYGLGEDRSGLLLLISMGERDWYISTAGSAIYIFTYDILGVVGDDVAGYLSEGKYGAALMEFASLADKYLTDAKNKGGESGDDPYYHYDYDNNYEYSTRIDIAAYLQAILISLLIAAIISLIVVLVMKSKLKSVRRKLNARDYVRRDSLNITNSSEFYLYRTVSRVAKPQNPPPSSGNRSGGGSFGGTHTSSSGSSHGGRGGKF